MAMGVTSRVGHVTTSMAIIPAIAMVPRYAKRVGVVHIVIKVRLASDWVKAGHLT